METVQTYHANPQLKADFLAQISAHEQADALVKGSYGRMNGHFKGCAIGCSAYSLAVMQGQLPKNAGLFASEPQHRRVADDLGLPLWLAYLEDNVFEMLPTELSKTWPRRLAEAIPVGAVIDDRVLAQILVWSLTAERFGAIHATDNTEVKGWMTTIAEAISAEAEGRLTDEMKATADGAARAARAALGRLGRLGRAWDARDAWAAWAAWAAETRGAFYPALSEYVLTVVRALPATAR